MQVLKTIWTEIHNLWKYYISGNHQPITGLQIRQDFINQILQIQQQHKLAMLHDNFSFHFNDIDICLSSLACFYNWLAFHGETTPQRKKFIKHNSDCNNQTSYKLFNMLQLLWPKKNPTQPPKLCFCQPSPILITIPFHYSSIFEFISYIYTNSFTTFSIFRYISLHFHLITQTLYFIVFMYLHILNGCPNGLQLNSFNDPAGFLGRTE